MSKQSVKVSKAALEAEIRAVARKMAHRPLAEIVAYLREARGIPAEPDFVQECRK